MKNLKTILIVAGIIALAAIIVLIYFTLRMNADENVQSFEDCAKKYPVMESYPARCVTKDGRSFTQTVSNPTPSPTPDPARENNDFQDDSVVYLNQAGGYSFNYSDKLFTQYKTTNVLPHNQQKVPVDEFKYSIPVEHCDLSGKCTNFTDNMKWGTTFISGNINTIKSAPDPERFVKINKFPTIDADIYQLEMGAEGEGIIYYYIVMPDNKIIIVYRYYIDENILINYKNAKGFIPLKQQEFIFDAIVGSLD